jgi:hypothetical protein
MLKRFALMIAATAVLAIPASGSFAAPQPQADGVAPEEACHTALPWHTQPLLCGRGKGGEPGHTIPG